MAAKGDKSEREARLAAALRANLRRRKAHAPSISEEMADGAPADPQRPVA